MTNLKRGDALQVLISGLDEAANPLIPTGALNDNVIQIGPNGLLGLVKTAPSTDPCDDSIWDCPGDNQAVVIPLWNGNAAQASACFTAPANFFGGQALYLDFAASTPDIPVYVINALPPGAVGAPDPALFGFVGWIINTGLTGELMEVVF